MIDFHSHILPGMDDGAKDESMSLRMMEESRRQGVRTMVATPHFYPVNESPAEFLKRRSAAWDRLRTVRRDDTCPDICLGAEVAYFDGISGVRDIASLCIRGTNLLLIEMPFCRWNPNVISSLYRLQEMYGIQPVIAHIERYIGAQPKGTLGAFLENGILIQSNAENFIPFFAGRKAVRMLRDEQIHLLGTDCHNMERRAPNLGAAREKILASVPAEDFEMIMRYAEYLLTDAEKMSGCTG